MSAVAGAAVLLYASVMDEGHDLPFWAAPVVWRTTFPLCHPLQLCDRCNKGPCCWQRMLWGVEEFILPDLALPVAGRW